MYYYLAVSKYLQYPNVRFKSLKPIVTNLTLTGIHTYEVVDEISNQNVWIPVNHDIYCHPFAITEIDYKNGLTNSNISSSISYNTSPYRVLPVVTLNKDILVKMYDPKCECGVEKANVGGRHSDWCPKYNPSEE